MNFRVLFSLKPNGSLRVGVFRGFIGILDKTRVKTDVFVKNSAINHMQNRRFRQNRHFRVLSKTLFFTVSDTKESYLKSEVQQISGKTVILVKLTYLSLFGSGF